VLERFGSVRATADAVGVSSQAVSQWPDPLPPRIEDRVVAALARRSGRKPKRKAA
jgi:hypothetical protein